MLLRHADVRAAAKNWELFSSDAPFKVPIPTEENVRTVRQLPLEVDPPVQQEYRALVEPFFNRAKLPEVIVEMEELVDALVAEALAQESIEIVKDFAIPLQSRALAILLNMPQSEAEVWIGWGMHIFREGNGGEKGSALERYTNQLLDRAAAGDGSDFFSALTRARFQGMPLSRTDMLGFCSIVFAGGRDTVISSISGIIGHLGANPADLEYLREDPARIVGAAEEFFRVLSPSTHLARLCRASTEIHGHRVEAGEFVSLNFAAANYDETVFPSPEEVRLNRRPNPHVAFGFGPHLCLGAAHARLVARTLMKVLCQRVARIDVVETVDRYENESTYRRRVAFEKLRVRLVPR